MPHRPARRKVPPSGSEAVGSRPSSSIPARKPAKPFDVHEFLESAGLARRVAEFRRNEVVYSQGDPAGTVIYIQYGGVKLSVVSSAGKEAVVAMLGPGEFFGEGCLAGQAVRMGTAVALVPSTLLLVEREQMRRVLHEQSALSDLFIAHVLARNLRVEEDLIDQLFNSSEKRLARTLLLLARYGQPDVETGKLPRVSQEVLAEMVGTTRSRVNFFMNRFRRLGFIDYNGGIKIHSSLLSVVLHD